MSDWKDNIVPTAARLFAELRREFTVQQIKHIAGALDRQVGKAERGFILRTWRTRHDMTPAQAAMELGIAVEDVLAVEDETLKVGPEAMRPIRQALRRCRREIEDEGEDEPEGGFKT